MNTFPRLTVRRMGEVWWIVGHDDGPWGPYDSKQEAESDRRGISRTMRYKDDHSFWTTEVKKET